MTPTQIADKLIRFNPNATVLDLYKALNTEPTSKLPMQDKTQSSVVAAVGYLLDKKSKLRIKQSDHTFKRICELIERETGFRPSEYLVDNRKQQLADIRHLLRYCLAKKTKLKQSELGIMTGNVDRTTVINSLVKWQNIMDTEKHNYDLTMRILACI